jgi:hypothetical protein
MNEAFIRLLGAITIEQAVPFLILIAQGLFLILILFRSQSRNDFDVANFLRDENGKESSGRAFSFIALAISSWIMATLTFMKLMTVEYLVAFLVVWAGTPALLELIKRWNGTLPFSRGGMAFPQTKSDPPKEM